VSALRRRIAEAQVAVMFLTRLPAGPLPDKVPTIAQAAWAFPLAGLLVGAISGAVFVAMASVLPGLPAALLALATSAIVTGALHEDGLADLADGFGGGQDKAAKLDIMRDSRIGSYGVVALILTLALTGSAIAEAGSFLLFLVIGTASRTAMVIALALMPPARDNGLGQAAALKRGATVPLALLIAVTTAALAGSLLLLIPIALITFAIARLAMRQIGGQTGDVMGAIQKLGECGAWLTAAALIG